MPLFLLAVLSPPIARAEVKGPLGAALDRYMEGLAGFGYSGSVLVAQKGEVVLNQGYGLADRARGTPFTADTLFDIASISKPFTAAAVLRLEMKGKLKVEDRIFPLLSRRASRQGGDHPAPAADPYGRLPETIGPEYETLARKAFLRRLFATKLVHRPGERFLYSNAGYSLLAAVVEVASGRPFGEVLRAEVFLPAGMRHTGFLPDAADRPRLAHGYTGDGDWGTSLDHPHAPDGPWWNLRGNGGILTTTGDFYRWHVALQGDAVLSKPEREKYQSPKVPEGRGEFPKYAYGWSVSRSPSGTRMLSHVGGNGVFQTDYRRYPAEGAVIAIGSNTDDYSAIAIANQLEQRLFGEPVVELPATRPAVATELRRCAGTYTLASGERIEVAAEPSRLVATPEGREGLTLLSGKPGAERQRRFAEREQKVAGALAAAVRGNLGPLAGILVDSDAAAKRWRATVAAREAELGPWTGVTMLGTRSIGGQIVSHARLAFKRGTRVLDVVWSGPTIDHLAVGRNLWPTYFLPEGPSRFVTYDVGTGTVAHLSCEGAGAAASALSVESPGGGAVKAKRRPAG